MPTTAGSTARGLPYPGDTGSSPDGPASFKALADAIEAMMNSPLVLGSTLTALTTITAQGTGTSGLVLLSSSSGADLKRSRLLNDTGVTRLQSLTDAFALSKTGLTMDHATGVVDHPNGATATSVAASGAVTAASVTASGAVSAASVAASGAATVGGTLTATGGVADGRYRTLRERTAGTIGPAFAAGTYGVGVGGATPLLPATGHNVFWPSAVMWLDPADYDTVAKAAVYRLRARILTGSTAPAVTFTVGLYPVTSSGATTLGVTFGTVVSGSTVAVVNPAASSYAGGVSGDFTPPAAGMYVLGVVISGSTAINSNSGIVAELQVRVPTT